MATTYQRLHTGLRRANRRNEWKSDGQLVAAIRKTGHADFRIAGVVLSEEAVERLVRLMVELGLLSRSAGGQLTVPAGSKVALQSASRFQRKVQMGVHGHLENRGLSIDDILRAIGGIAFPEIPDAEAIHVALYEGVAESDQKVTVNGLRRLLYLYAAAGGIDRKVRVHYQGQ